MIDKDISQVQGDLDTLFITQMLDQKGSGSQYMVPKGLRASRPWQGSFAQKFYEITTVGLIIVGLYFLCRWIFG